MSLTGTDVHEPSSDIPPSVTEVERIAALTDPIMRNLQITHCYHRLPRALAARTSSSGMRLSVAIRRRRRCRAVAGGDASFEVPGGHSGHPVRPSPARYTRW
ncbi:hypothetical protein [Lentzea sp. E54]|uniref:hypothetical protein n=1 Tax=Lentzea xerophila TaxID=3435883 RepID=UPI003DA49A90